MDLVSVPTLPGTLFRLPPQLEGLRRLAYNLWWTWHPRAKILFSRIDGTAWARYRSPIPVLSGSVSWADLLDNPAKLIATAQRDDGTGVRATITGPSSLAACASSRLV